MEEIFRPVNGFDGIYCVSNLGRIKSLKRIIMRSNAIKQTIGERFLKYGIGTTGYCLVVLYKNGIGHTKKVHLLVWEAFGKEKREGHELQIDHIDNNKLHNSIENLQLLNNRQNSSKKSLLPGASFQPSRNKWLSSIMINGKNKTLGRFSTAIQAHEAYKKELKKNENP